MRVISSVPNSPPSPACGFRPQTATRWRVKPKSRQASAANSTASRIFSGRSWAETSFSGRCVVASATRSQRAPVVGAEQHHGGVGGAGQFGEKFGLTDERLAASHHGFLVQRRGHQRIHLVLQAALRAVGEPSDRSARGDGRTGFQISGQRFAAGIVQKAAAVSVEFRKRSQVKFQL